MRLIDADELKKMFMYAEDAEYAKWSLNGVISEIDDAPTVDVLERIRAEIQHLADLELLNMKLVLQIIDKYIKEQTE